jgi:hypothetical protein
MCSAVTVTFRVRKSVRLLNILVVTSFMYKCSVNRVTHTRDTITELLYVDLRSQTLH